MNIFDFFFSLIPSVYSKYTYNISRELEFIDVSLLVYTILIFFSFLLLFSQNALASYDFSSNDQFPYPRYTDDWFNRYVYTYVSPAIIIM